MKVGAYDVACSREHAAQRKSQENREHFSQSTILWIYFKFVWAVYGGDLTVFC